MEKKKNQRVINRTPLIGPFLGPLVYMGDSPVILCGCVCHCVNPGDWYWVYWKWCFSICDRIHLWGKFAKFVCRTSSTCGESQLTGKHKGWQQVCLGYISAPLCPPLAPVYLLFRSSTLPVCHAIPVYPGHKVKSAVFHIATSVIARLSCCVHQIVFICSKILSLMHKSGFMLVSTGVEQKHIVLFKLYLSYFSAPRVSCKPLQSKFKAIAMKETSISILSGHNGCSNMSKYAESPAPQWADYAWNRPPWNIECIHHK